MCELFKTLSCLCPLQSPPAHHGSLWEHNNVPGPVSLPGPHPPSTPEHSSYCIQCSCFHLCPLTYTSCSFPYNLPSWQTWSCEKPVCPINWFPISIKGIYSFEKRPVPGSAHHCLLTSGESLSLPSRQISSQISVSVPGS